MNCQIRTDQPEPAVRLWAAAEALREAIGEETFANAWAEGRGLAPEQALDA